MNAILYNPAGICTVNALATQDIYIRPQRFYQVYQDGVRHGVKLSIAEAFPVFYDVIVGVDILVRHARRRQAEEFCFPTQPGIEVRVIVTNNWRFPVEVAIYIAAIEPTEGLDNR